MKDHLFLIVAGTAVSIFAWAFWHFLGDDAFTAITLIALVVVVADNHRLRSKLRRHNA